MRPENESASFLFERVFEEASRRWGVLAALGAVVLLGNYGTAVVLGAARSLYDGHGLLGGGLRVGALNFASAGIVPIMLASLWAEARALGWERSSVRRLFEGRTQSVRTDLFYLVLNASNLHVAAGLALTFGLGAYAQFKAEGALAWGLLKGAPWFVQFTGQWFVGSFVFYAVHWLHHTRWLWEIHKVHHAAEEMTMATNFRAHPVTYALRTVCDAFVAGALGVHPLVFISYLAITGVAVVWQHSTADWGLGWLERYVFIGAAAHRLHHSKVERYYTTNLGFFVFWDWLFGTLRSDPAAMTFPIGVDDPLHNRLGPVREMLAVQGVGLRALLRGPADAPPT